MVRTIPVIENPSDIFSIKTNNSCKKTIHSEACLTVLRKYPQLKTHNGRTGNIYSS